VLQETDKEPEMFENLSDRQLIEYGLAAVIGVQVIMGILILQACRRIAKNEVELADLLRDAVEQIENDIK
jgi:hypothetical protein